MRDVQTYNQIDPDMQHRINDLLYLQKEFVNRMNTEIDELMRGRGRSNQEIKDSLIYMIDDRLN